VLNAAEAKAEAMKDEYVSVEHTLLALAESKDPAGEVLRSQGVTAEAIMGVLKDIRGTQRVSDQNPEDKYQALKRFARDLTEAGRKGQAGPGDRPRRGDPPGHPDSQPPHQEQPGAHR
jgi:ATP-dependent Clp protease ATP-binding subunit ClpB